MKIYYLFTQDLLEIMMNFIKTLDTESSGLVGWEHSMKNELIMAENIHQPKKIALDRLEEIYLQDNNKIIKWLDEIKNPHDLLYLAPLQKQSQGRRRMQLFQ